jgi:hypothetical protein
MLIEEGYAHSLRSLLQKSHAMDLKRTPRESHPSRETPSPQRYPNLHRGFGTQGDGRPRVPAPGAIFAAVLVLLCLMVYFVSL